MAVALTNLLKKDVFHWFTKSQQTFDSLKTTLTHAPVLALSNFAKPFVLETDASSTGKGAVLSQNSHPIAFFWKKMSPLMQKQSGYAREMYAITTSVAKF